MEARPPYPPLLSREKREKPRGAERCCSAVRARSLRLRAPPAGRVFHRGAVVLANCDARHRQAVGLVARLIEDLARAPPVRAAAAYHRVPPDERGPTRLVLGDLRLQLRTARGQRAPALGTGAARRALCARGWRATRAARVSGSPCANSQCAAGRSGRPTAPRPAPPASCGGRSLRFCRKFCLWCARHSGAHPSRQAQPRTPSTGRRRRWSSPLGRPARSWR